LITFHTTREPKTEHNRRSERHNN